MTATKNRITIYLPEDERNKWQRLMEKLANEGIDLVDEKRPDRLSMSKMLRYLVSKESGCQDR